MSNHNMSHHFLFVGKKKNRQETHENGSYNMKWEKRNLIASSKDMGGLGKQNRSIHKRQR